MTTLAPMSPAVFAEFRESSVVGYAQENVASGRWPADGAVERARDEFDSLLPQGLATPEHHLFEIRSSAAGTRVGFLWFAVQERHGLRGAYVYDVEIQAEYRRRGHARRAFQALEPIVAALGLSSIGLHVFGHNAGAQALYRQLGYAVTGINMLKTLDGPGRPVP